MVGLRRGVQAETAVAVEEVRLLRVSYADFQDLVLESMDLGREIYRVLAREIEAVIDA